MMERVDPTNQEEFIWVMRTKMVTGTQDDGVSWKERKSSMYSRGMVPASAEEVRRETESANQTKIIASLVPNEVIDFPEEFEHRNYDAVFMLCYVSGYNSRYDYEKISKDDINDVLEYLNGTIGYIVKTLLLNEGDVINFSDDTFFVLWKSLYHKDRSPCVTNALKSAFMIIQHFKATKVDPNEEAVAVKLSISFGRITFTLIGTEDNPNYLLIGKPMSDAKKALDIAEFGDIVVTSTAWDQIIPEPYNFDRFSDHYIKVYGVSQSYRASMDAKIRSGLRSYAKKHRPFVMEYGDDGIFKEEFALRQELFAAVNLQMMPQLRRFIVEPVLKYIENREPIDGLNETRHLVNVVVVCEIERGLDARETVNAMAYVYEEILSVAQEHEGCITDVYTLSDAMTVSVTFGLRGMAHNVECRRGLRCAHAIWSVFQEYPLAKRLTVAVTSGKSFCGMVGHPQRRQYVTIGKHMTLAIRLAQAIQDQIVCDRETFLRSGYGAQNFFFRSDHPVRDIKNIGPIYTFEKHRKSIPSTASLKYPILDRSQEMNTYLNMLKVKRHFWKQEDKPRVAWQSLVVLGPSRGGRSRLADEYYYVNTGVRRSKVRLRATDRGAPYQAIYLLLMEPLGLSENSSRSDREAKLLHFMRRIKSKDLFWAMNVIFKVNFPIDDFDVPMDENERIDALVVVLKDLCRACFSELWTIIVDGGEFIDSESWLLFHAVVDTRLAFLVLTVCSNVTLHPKAKLFLSSSSVRTIHMKPIAKWYCIGLACQFLDVVAIPSQLEMVLQQKSDGNPGWIECYLTSLIQENCIYLKQLGPTEERSDLVYVPVGMLQRRQNLIYEAEDLNDDETGNVKYYLMLREKWKMYRESYITETADSDKHGEKRFVCLLNFDLPDCTSNSPESVVVQIIDSLNSYEQMIIKCCSLIGDDIPRVMLVHIVSRYNEVLFAKAIQKFFELNILGCLEGHFAGHSGSAIIRPHKNVRFEQQEELACRCVGLDTPQSCSSLPKYAMCGYMYFRVDTFRQMAYRYLIASERKLYHNKAMSYLEVFTMKCMKCGGGSFKPDPDATGECSRAKTKTRKNVDAQLQTSKSDVSCTPIAAKKSPDAAKSRSELDIIRIFNKSEYDSCECSLILSCMYTQLTHHYLALGMTYKWLLAMLEYAVVSIELYNIPLALKILNSALDVIKTGNASSCRQHEGEVWQTTHLHAKVIMLIGKSRLELRQYKQAYQMLKKALKLYGCKYKANVKFLNVKEHMLLSFKSAMCLKTTKHQYIADYFENVSECFTLMCKLFMHLDMWKKAEVAAMMALKHALKSSLNYPMQLTTYCDTMAILLHNKKISLVKNVEQRAVECYTSTLVVNYREMKAILFLYRNQFLHRIVLNELDKAIKLGPTIVQLNQGLMGIANYDYEVTAMLFYCLLLRKRIAAAHEVLMNLRVRSEMVSDYRGKVWYHTLCLVLQLETGYSVVSYQQCVKVYQNNLRIMSTDASKQLLACLWLWCERLGHGEDGEKWKQNLDVLWSLHKNETMVNVVTGLYYLEALIVHHVNARNVKNVRLMATKRAEVRTMISALLQSVVHLKCYMPRLYLLHSYFCYVQGLEDEGDGMLRRALKTAKVNGNVFECGMIKHNAKAWSGEMPMSEQYFWTDHALEDPIAVVDNDDEPTINVGYYTYRLPEL